MLNTHEAHDFAVRAVLEQYFHAIDSRNEILLTECFAPDASVHYHKGFEAEVRLSKADAIARFLLHRTSQYRATNHHASNTRVVATGDSASAVTYAVAHVVLAQKPKILVRGIRYDDQLALTDGRWQIQSRLHVPLWQYEAVSVPPAIPH